MVQFILYWSLEYNRIAELIVLDDLILYVAYKITTLKWPNNASRVSGAPEYKAGQCYYHVILSDMTCESSNMVVIPGVY